jgi:hypothetical protein
LSEANCGPYSNGHISSKNAWVHELLTAGLRPTVRTLARVLEKNGESAEVRWILRLRAGGAALTNAPVTARKNTTVGVTMTVERLAGVSGHAPLIKFTLWGYRCLRCGHGWPPRLKQDVDLPRPPKVENEPRICPKCKSPYWNVPRRKAG